MGFFHKVKPFIANLLQFFLELNRNIDKDYVIDKFLDFQNAFDSLLILLQLCMCDVGDSREQNEPLPYHGCANVLLVLPR